MTEIELQKYWTDLITIHKLAKKCALLSENYSLDLETFIPIIKEQRDAHEHVMRAYSVALQKPEKMSVAEQREYVLKNMDGAIGHEYRALYDAYEYLYIQLAARIDDMCKNYLSATSLHSLQADRAYIESMDLFMDFPYRIAQCRDKKDIGFTNDDIKNLYQSILDDMIATYRSLSHLISRKSIEHENGQ